MLENTISEENGNYIQEYFQYLFVVFRKNILHVFDGCTDIRLNDMIKEKFGPVIRTTNEFMKKDFRVSEHSSLIQVTCQNNYIKCLGIGEVDFDGIAIPNHDQEEVLKLARTCNELTEPEKKDLKNQK